MTTEPACCGSWESPPAPRRAAPAPPRQGMRFSSAPTGFWEFVYNEEMLADCLKSHTPEEWIHLMLPRHIRRTPTGNDNFSLIAVFVEDEEP